MRPITFLIIFLSCLFSEQLLADVTFSISPTSTTAAIGTQVTFTIAVTGFDDLNGFQFPIEYDETKLQYVNGTAAALSSIPSDTVGYINFTSVSTPTNKWIRATYFFFSIAGGPTGRTIPSGTTILTLRFNKIAAGTADLQFSPTLDPKIQVIEETDALFLVGQTPYSFTASINPPPPPSNLTFTISKDTIAAGGNTCLSVRAKGFTNMTTFQLGIAYDTTKLLVPPSFVLGTPLAPDLLVVIPPIPNRHQIRAIWTAPTLMNGTPIPLTLPDSSLLYSVCFVAKPGASGLDSVKFSGFQTPSFFTNEFTNATGPVTNAVLRNGHVFINGGAPVAPLTFTIASDSTSTSAITCLPIRTKSFTNMLNFQLGITYDTTKLVVPPTIQLGTALGAQDLLVIVPPLARNQIRAIWTAPFDTMNAQIPRTLPDSTVLYSVCVTSKPGATGTAAITFSNFQTPTLFVQEHKSTAGLLNNVVLNNGSVIFKSVVVPPVVVPLRLTIEKDSVQAGQQVCTDVRAFGWRSMTGMTMGMTYDTSKLVFSSVAFTPNPLNNPADFQAIHLAAASQIRLNYAAPAGTSTTLLDSTVILQVCFNAKSTAQGLAPVQFSAFAAPAPVVVQSFTNTSGAFTNYTLIDGSVTVIGQVNPCAATTLAIPTATIVQSNVGCFGGNNGTINVSPTGGAAPYVVTWTGPGGVAYTGTSITGLVSGAYTPKLVDANGCSITGTTITITQPSTSVDVTLFGVPVNVTCANGINGSIMASTAGGTAPYTYIWKNLSGQTVATTEDVSNLPIGNYSLTVTDSRGCTDALNGNVITQPMPIIVSSNASVPVTCPGTSTGFLNLTVSGGTGAYTYNWNPNVATTRNLQNVPMGQYSVTISDVNGCQGQFGPYTVGGPTPMTYNGTPTSTATGCGSTGTGTIQIAISGGSGSYSARWQPGNLTGLSLTGLAAGTYTPTITDGSGCTVVLAPVSVNSNAAIVYSGAPVISPIKCSNTNDGGISIGLSGGAGGYQVAWFPGGFSGTSISGIGAGTYTPTVTDVQNCTVTLAGITLNAPAAIVLAGVPSSQTITTPPNGSIDLSVTGGTNPYTYAWTGAITSSNQDISGAPSGTYTVTVRDNNQCSATASYTITNTAATGQLVSVVNACGFTGGCVKMSTLGLTLPYNLTYAGITVTVTENPFTVCGLASGIYAFNITGANGLPVTINATVNNGIPAVVNTTITNVTIDNQGGKIKFTPNINAPGVYTYLWPNGATSDSLINLDAGKYCVTVTNTTSGCTSLECHEIKYPDAVFSTSGIKQPKCGSNDGAITINFIGANGPKYRYVMVNQAGTTVLDSTLSFTQITASNLAAGTYTITVIDETPTSFTIPSVTLTSTGIAATAATVSNYLNFAVSSPDKCNGSVTVTPTQGLQPFSYTWSTGAGVNSATNNVLCAGAYSVVVTDATGCSLTLSGSLTAPTAVVVLASAQSQHSGFNVTCKGVCNGISRVAATGGVAPYEVTWSNGQKGILEDQTDFHDIFQLCAGTYTVTLTDAVGTTKVSQAVITEPAAIELTYAQIAPSRFTACDGIMTLVPVGVAGAPVITWSVNGGATGTGPKVENLCVGKVVTYLLVDNNGCTATGRDTVPYPQDGCLEISPVITPGNQDGKNDVLFITCIEATPINRVEVFNQFGQVVFDQTGYINNDVTKSWSGLTKRGQALPEGVYFIVLTYTNDIGETVVKKTYANLVRS
jgi:CHU_C Type IX secretion signal domain/SprB repeat/Cohesin domain